MISVKSKGTYRKVSSYFEKILEVIKLGKLDKYGRQGVEALKNSTPVDTGKTANSWYYKIDRTDSSVTISWHNSNINDNVNIAVLLEYGHGLSGGGYVQGVDYINPAMVPVFNEIADNAWEEVLKA